MQDEELDKALAKRLGGADKAFASPTINYWMSTGSPVLDLALREWKKSGGWPGGKLIDLYGRNHAGKTSLCLRTARSCQQQGGRVFYLNTTEQGFNPELAITIGANVTEKPSDSWCLLNVFSLEGWGDVCEEIAEERHERDEPTLVITDSLSSLGLMKYTMDGDDATSPSAAGAKWLHEFFRRGIFYYMTGSKIVLMVIRHQTDTPRVSFTDKTTHGSSVDFYSWLRVRMTRSDMQDADGGKRCGSWLTAKVVKNKVGSLYGEVSMPFYTGKGFNAGLEVFWALKEFGKLEGSGARYIWDGKSYYMKELVDLYATSAVVKEQALQLLRESGGKKVVEKKKK